jgi:catalase (peroxidase I)
VAATDNKGQCPVVHMPEGNWRNQGLVAESAQPEGSAPHSPESNPMDEEFNYAEAFKYENPDDLADALPRRGTS